MAKKKKIKEPPYITLKGRRGNTIYLYHKNFGKKYEKIIKEIFNIK